MSGLGLFIIIAGILAAGLVTGICMLSSDRDYEKTDNEIDAEIMYLQEVKRRNQMNRREQKGG